MTGRPNLPIEAILSDVTGALSSNRSVIVCAPPGAGKTTRVPPAILKSGCLSAGHPKILLLQPRRIAARAAAARIAAEQGWSLGQEVGYQVRFEKRTRRETRIEVLTEGILNRRLLSDPFLDGVGAVILDEFHERSLHSDLAIALLKEVQATVREDLRIVVMSATLDAEAVSQFLSGAPVIRSKGRSFAVQVEYFEQAAGPTMGERVIRAIEEEIERPPDSMATSPGHVLVFLPGMEEIRRAWRGIEAVAQRRGARVCRLHGSLSTAEQDEAFAPCPQRKVVLATNVAETSVTIEGVSTVIDTGLERVAVHDPRLGLDRLALRRISRASAQQRAGRAGRTGPGRCLRLWSRRDERAMADFELPEVRRVDLAATVLTLHSWGVKDPGEFGWYESPGRESLEAAGGLLRMLGAVDGSGRITKVGESLLNWPLHPRIGRLLLGGAESGVLSEAAAIAAILSEKDFTTAGEGRELRRTPWGTEASVRSDSDLLVRLDLLHRAEEARFSSALRSEGIDPQAARRVVQARDDLLRITRGVCSSFEAGGLELTDELLLGLPLLAFPDRVCRRRAEGDPRAVMVGGRGVRLHPASTVRAAEFFVALDAREEGVGRFAEATVRTASAIDPGWLASLYPADFVRQREVRFDRERRRVVGVVRLKYRDLVLSEEIAGGVESEEAAVALVAEFGSRAAEIIRGDDAAARWLDRVAFMRAAVPEIGMPEFGIEALQAVLADGASGCVSEEQLRKVRWTPFLGSRLTHPKARELEQEAPDALTVPSGSRIRVSYEEGRPRLSARVQELFGWAEAPRLGRGRVAVLLEILGPSFRPVQVTEDLRSFWTTTYAQVRKDLRARYPRHAWPEDPWGAQAEAKGGRRFER